MFILLNRTYLLNIYHYKEYNVICYKNVALTSASHEYFNGNVLQQVPAREYCSDLRKVPFSVQMIAVFQNLWTINKQFSYYFE